MLWNWKDATAAHNVVRVNPTFSDVSLFCNCNPYYRQVINFISYFIR